MTPPTNIANPDALRSNFGRTKRRERGVEVRTYTAPGRIRASRAMLKRAPNKPRNPNAEGSVDRGLVRQSGQRLIVTGEDLGRWIYAIDRLVNGEPEGRLVYVGAVL